jgi:hypothetical protein
MHRLLCALQVSRPRASQLIGERAVELTFEVSPPARQETIGLEPAGVLLTQVQLQEQIGRNTGDLTIGIQPPTPGFVAVVRRATFVYQPAGVPATGDHCRESAVGRGRLTK